MFCDRPTCRSGRDAAAPSGVRWGLSWLDGVPTAVLVSDRDGVIRYSNLAASELLNPPAAGLAHCHLLDLVADQDRGVAARQLRRAVGGEPRPYSVVYLRSGARQVPYLLAAAPSRPGDGGEIVWVIARPGLWNVDGADGGLTDLASALSRLSRLRLLAEPVAVVRGAVWACHTVTGPHSGVSLSLRLDGLRELTAGTSTSTQEWDSAQLLAGQGPVVVAAREASVVRCADLACDPRFPGLRGSIPSGHTAVSSPLIVAETVLGVLTAYDVAGSLLDPGDPVLPTLTAATVAIARELQVRPHRSES